jgi:hypothetical protein
MRTARKIRYRLEWLGLKSATKFLPLLSRKACYRLALLLGSLGAMLDRRGRRVALSNLRVAFGDAEQECEQEWGRSPLLTLVKREGVPISIAARFQKFFLQQVSRRPVLRGRCRRGPATSA